MPTLTRDQERALRQALRQSPFWELVGDYDSSKYDILLEDVVYQGRLIPSDEVELHHYVWSCHYKEPLPDPVNTASVEAETEAETVEYEWA